MNDKSPGFASPFPPYVPATTSMAELTLRAVLLGAGMSFVFGMVNAYLGLKVGITVSASIPSAVLSMAILRGLMRRGTILENNLVHTIASSGESLAAGVIFTVPALIFIGLDPSGFRIFLIATTAGLLGVLMMIPLRHSLTVREHHNLPYPEGTACAKVLIAGDQGRTAARPVFLGIAIGAAYQFLMRGLQLWREEVFISIAALRKMSFGAQCTPLLLGVGYLVGWRVAATIAAGGFIAWAILIPVFNSIAGTPAGLFFGLGADAAALEARAIWSRYVRYVGAGAVACGGLVSITRALPVIADSFRKALTGLRFPAQLSAERTEKDLPPPLIFAGVALVALALWLVPVFEMGLIQTLLALGFTYFFVVVSARMVGLIGNTSQPISGMTITALLVTALVLHTIGYEGREGMGATLAVAVIVCVAVALAGDISQDLKCGALVGATPWVLQVGEMIGIAVAAVRAGWVLYILHAAYTLGSEMLPAPQAKLMATLAEGVMQDQLPWALMLLGALLAGVAELLGVSSLAFAIGLYLPAATTTPMLFGGLISYWRRRANKPDEPATLLSSGLIAGESLVGILIAALVYRGWDRHLQLRDLDAASLAETLATVIPFAAMAVVLARYKAAELSR